MRQAAIDRALERKYWEEFTLWHAREEGGWDHLAHYLVDTNFPIGRDMRAFLATVLREERRPPNKRARQALRDKTHRARLIMDALRNGAKNTEAALNEAAEKANVDIRTIRRVWSLKGSAKLKIKGLKHLLSVVPSGRDYDIDSMALTEHAMGPDTR
jgi:hypothetical protein